MRKVYRRRRADWTYCPVIGMLASPVHPIRVCVADTGGFSLGPAKNRLCRRGLMSPQLDRIAGRAAQDV